MSLNWMKVVGLNLKYQEHHHNPGLRTQQFSQVKELSFLEAVVIKELRSETYMLLIQWLWHGTKDHKVEVVLLLATITHLHLLEAQECLFLEDGTESNTLTMFMYLI